jgi:uncharacterized protein
MGRPRKIKDTRADGWRNVLTGIGDPTQDKRLSGRILYSPVSEREAEELYAADDVAGNMVEKPVYDAIRNWIDYLKIEKETANEIDDFVMRLEVKEKVEEALIVARIHGGSGLVPILDDGLDFSKPLDKTKIRRVFSFHVFSRWELSHTGVLVTDPRSLYFGLPEYYVLNPRSTTSSMSAIKIHHTRVIRFNGNFLPKYLFQVNNYWHDSVYSKTKNAIRNYSTSFDAASGLLADFQEGVLKSPGVADKIGAGKEDQVSARLRTFNMTRSVLKTIYLDSEESYETKTRTLAGVGEILDRMSDRLVSASGLPHTIMLGEGGKGGLGNEGVSEKKDYQASVKKLQESRIRGPLREIIELITAANSFSKKARADVEDGFGFNFRSIETMNEIETVALRKMQAETDKIYIDSQVVTPEEVGISRFGGDDGYSIETVIDTERIEDGQERLQPLAEKPEA